MDVFSLQKVYLFFCRFQVDLEELLLDVVLLVHDDAGVFLLREHLSSKFSGSILELAKFVFGFDLIHCSLMFFITSV